MGLGARSSGRRYDAAFASHTFAEYVGIAELCGYTDHCFATLGIPDEYGLANEYAGTLEVIRSAIGTERLALAMSAGSAVTEEDAIARAYALERTSA